MSTVPCPLMRPSLGIVLKLSTPYGEFGSSTFPNSDARSELGSVWVLGSKLGEFIQCMRRGGHLRLLHWIESFWFASLIFQHVHVTSYEMNSE